MVVPSKKKSWFRISLQDTPFINHPQLLINSTILMPGIMWDPKHPQMVELVFLFNGWIPHGTITRDSFPNPIPMVSDLLWKRFDAVAPLLEGLLDETWQETHGFWHGKKGKNGTSTGNPWKSIVFSMKIWSHLNLIDLKVADFPFILIEWWAGWIQKARPSPCRSLPVPGLVPLVFVFKDLPERSIPGYGGWSTIHEMPWV